MISSLFCEWVHHCWKWRISFSYLCIYVGWSESNASYLFPWKLSLQRAQKHNLTGQILSYKILFFNSYYYYLCIFTSKEQEPACHTQENLHQQRSCDPELHRCYDSTVTRKMLQTVQLSLFSHPLFDLHKCSTSICECQWVRFHLHGGIQWRTFAPYALPRQMPFRHIVPLLPSVTHNKT